MRAVTTTEATTATAMSHVESWTGLSLRWSVGAIVGAPSLGCCSRRWVSYLHPPVAASAADGVNWQYGGGSEAPGRKNIAHDDLHQVWTGEG